MIRVVCLKWGDKYSPDYVNRLYHAVKRHLALPFEFYCLTENDKGLVPEVNVIFLPDLGLQGWWYKLLLFKKGFLDFEHEDTILYLDLDVVVLGDLSLLLNEFSEGLSISADNQPDRMNSSVMIFKPDSLGFLWDSFFAQRKYIIEHFHGDQDWIERVFPSANILPKSLVCSFKADLDSKTPFSFGTLGRFLRRKFPVLLPKGEVEKPDCSIVLFHGHPNPDEVMNGPWDKYRHAPWVKNNWLES